MDSTYLFDALCAEAEKQGPSLASAEYRGATVAARFGDPQEEFSALLNACAVYDLGYRSRILVTGNDRVRWLNGMVSNKIRDLALGQGVYAFLLNPQGRILADLYVFNAGEWLTVETDRSQLESVKATFERFIIMDDVELKDSQQQAIGTMGPKSRAVLKAAGIGVPETMRVLETIAPRCNCDCECVDCLVLRGDNPASESYEIWLEPKDAPKTWRALIAAGAQPAGSEAVEMQRVAAGVPLYGVDIRERDLPQETEQARALNFNKGCYIGQEIVERIRSRGNVHRTFVGLVVEADAAISAGAKILTEGKETGEITSIARVPTPLGERTIALGYIRREFGIAGREVTIGDAKAKVVQLPLDLHALRKSDEAMLHRV